jgi:IS30 family transposase
MSQITKEQRYTIQVLHQNGMTQEKIAEAIGKHKSSVSRELKRNVNERGRYIYTQAHEISEIRKERFHKPRVLTPSMQKEIEERLKEGWSPEEITGRYRMEGKPIVSHETIYGLVRCDKESGGKWYKYLRHELKHRKRRKGDTKIPVKNRTGIEKRPEIVNNKERFGDWEMDTIIGKNGRGAILTIVERQTGFHFEKKLDGGKNALSLAKDIVKLLLPYKQYIHTITTDNGTEFAEHEFIAKKLEADIYFSHPYSAWEKGLIEYTNKLIRQYIPKGSSFCNINNMEIKEIQYRINRRARKKLGYKTPFEVFSLHLSNLVAFAC